MKNRYILLLLLLFLGISDAIAQSVQVETTGVVYDKSTGETLPGVNILCRDAKTKKRIRGTISDLEGRFKIKSPLGVELYFTNVSMKPVTYKVNKAATGITIFMVEDVKEIEETVIVHPDY